ncbi:hypothetical protein CL617_00210 [archaeon]|nr:hypothetical protein [archaeon]|tara:strand:+ start:15095 stop:15673 length:579 start_codon:yes stop_codon:yes gene_type:complete
MQEEFSIDYVYEALRNERLNSNLQEIDQDFFTNVSKFIKEQEEVIRDTQDISESSRLEKHLESIKRVIKDLYERREFKIIQLAISNLKTSSENNLTLLLQEEREFYNATVENFNYFRTSILENINKGMLPELKPKEIKSNTKPLKTIRFLEKLPGFIGTDLNVYGPFEKEYISNLPLDIADYLIKNKKAEEI